MKEGLRNEDVHDGERFSVIFVEDARRSISWREIFQESPAETSKIQISILIFFNPLHHHGAPLDDTKAAVLTDLGETWNTSRKDSL